MYLLNLLASESGSIAESLSESVSNSANGGGGFWQKYGLLIGIVVIFIIMIVFSTVSRKKQQKALQEKLDGIKVGDRVKTIGLICGIVVDVNPDENTFVLETGKDNHGSFIKFDRNAIYQISSKKKEEKPSEKPANEEVKEQAENVDIASENPSEETK